jgi:flagellar basal-body rod protein FlgG
MLQQRRQMEIITNNITNADTTGYKKENLATHSFDDVMTVRIHDSRTGRVPQVGPLNLGTQVNQSFTDFSGGAFDVTGRTTDLALAGDVFFTLQTPAGERYSKAGAFLVSQQGYLVDGDGNYLLGESGEIYVGGEDFTVNERGDVAVGGETVDRLRLASFADNNALRKQGDNLYFSPAAAQNPTEYAVKQGYLETSNVDVAREMVDMLTVYRVYETNQKMLTMIDETVGKAVNDIGRVR